MAMRDFNPMLAFVAETIFLPVSDYINCIALFCSNKYVCMYVCKKVGFKQNSE